MKNKLALLEEFQNDPQSFIRRQINEFQKIKKAGFPMKFSVRQAEFDNKKLKLRSNSYFLKVIEENSNQLKEAKDELVDLNNRHDHYITSEKEGLPEKYFALQDKLKARLTSYKSRFAEVKKYMSNTKNK